MSIKTIKDNFSWIDMALTSAGGLVWFFQPDQIFLPFLLMLLPKFFLIKFSKFRQYSWAQTISLLIFLGFSALSAFNAYQSETSWNVFAWTAGAVLLFFSLASQPKEHFQLLIRALLFSGTFLAILMIFSNDLSQINPPSQILRSLNQRWMQIRPFSLNFYQDTDFISGYFALIFAPGLAILIDDIRKKEKILASLTLASLLINTFSLVILAEYDAWLGLISGLVFLCLLLAFNSLRKNFGITTSILITLTTLCLILSAFFFIPVAGNKNLFWEFLEKSGFSGRYEMAANTIQMLRDYPFLGAGWDSFSGVYSKYLLLIPNHFSDHCHNLFLNQALELGLSGFSFFMFFYLSTLIRFVKSELFDLKNKNIDLIKYALIWSWGTLFVHWFTEDPLYGSVFLIGLFLIPGLSISYLEPNNKELLHFYPRNRKIQEKKKIISLFIGVSVILVIIFSIKTILSAWYANRAVIELAKLELKGWPDDTVPIENELALSRVNSLFEISLFYNKNNVTANYHMGLLNLGFRNFSSANSQLIKANNFAPNHRGIIKALGFSYVWTGDIFNAAKALKQIPEASYELSIYSWWWQTEKRIDLSENADKTLEILNSDP